MLSLLNRVLAQEHGPPPESDVVRRYTLLEVWRGCVCPLKSDEKVLRVLDKWGFSVEGESVSVRLKVIEKSKYFRHLTDKR